MVLDMTDSPEPYVYVGAGTGGLYRKSPGEDHWEEVIDGLYIRILTLKI